MSPLSRTMTEYRTVSILVFRIFRGKYYFYLVKRGEKYPAVPETWTPIGSNVYPSDYKVAEELQSKYGDMVEDLPDKVTVLRLLLERELIHDAELQGSIPIVTDIDQKISKMDQAYLLTFFNSTVPWGRRNYLIGDDICDVNYYLCILPNTRFFKKTQLSQFSEYVTSDQITIEDKSKWFSTGKIIQKYNKLKSLFEPIIITFVSKIYTEKKKIIDVARELDGTIIDTRIKQNGFIPKILRFKTPAPTRTPFNMCNIYIVGNERQYIIDPGSTTSKAISVLEEYIEKNLDKIDGILLTNHYVDHCNQVPRLKEKFDIPLFASEETAKELADEGFVFNSYLKEGMKIYLGSYKPKGLTNWELEVVEIPGYTKGQLGYYDPRGILFSGSLLHKGIISTIGPYDAAYTDFINSLRKISKLPIKYILSGHGDIVTNVKEAINFNLKSIEKYEGFIINSIKDRISTKDELTEQLLEHAKFQWKDSANNLATILLSKLLQENIIQKRVDEYILT